MNNIKPNKHSLQSSCIQVVNTTQIFKNDIIKI